MAMVRCANATDQRHYFQEAEAWFMGLQKVYPQNIWNQTLVSFHKSGMIWESLALVASSLPQASSFYKQLLVYMGDLENFLWQAWGKDVQAWSFASARGLSIRWQSATLKTRKQRAWVRKWAQEHV